MKPEKQNLLDEILAHESGRNAALQAGRRILRRRRHWRLARRTLAALALIAATALLVTPSRPHQTLAQVSHPAPQPATPAPAQSLTDEQLLALFPGTPVGLATLPNGHKLLIFPRPADEARFVTRL